MQIVLFISFAFAVGLYIVQPLADPDLWWHIVSGRWIVANHSLPHKDIWTMFGGNADWIAYSWSNEVVFAIFDKAFGIAGLLFLQMSLAVIFALVLFKALGQIANNYFLGSLLGAAIVCGSHAHFALRPQSVVWIYLTLVLLLAENINNKGLTKFNITGLILVFCAWANAHITTVIGLGALFTWTLPNLPLRINSLKIPILSCLIAFFATLLTPYFGHEWIVFFTKSDHPLMFTSIQEFAPANILQMPTGFLILLAALVGFFSVLNPKAISHGQLLGAAVLTLGSLAVIKFLPITLIYLGFILAKQWSQTGVEAAAKPGLIQAIHKLDSLIRKIPKEGLSFLLICTAFVNAHNSWAIMLDDKYLPSKAIDYIQKNDLPLPIINAFGDGGYLSYRYADQSGNPGLKVSLDGRTNLISKELWQAYQKTWNGKWGWEEYFEMVKPKTVLWRSDSALVRILEATGKWCTVFDKDLKSVSTVVMLERSTVDELIKSGKNVSCL